MDTKEELDKLVENLARQRDELKRKLHLAKADARAEWEALEVRWQKMQSELGRLKNIAGEAGSEVAIAAKAMAEEMKKGYERIRKLF